VLLPGFPPPHFFSSPTIQHQHINTSTHLPSKHQHINSTTHQRSHTSKHQHQHSHQHSH
jgi:hypothetical protein